MSARAVLKDKKTSLELNREKSIRISYGFLFLSGLLFIILFNDVYYIKNPILLNIHVPFLISIPILAGLSLIMRYQRYEDKVFLIIMESLDLHDKGLTDPEFYKQAAEKLEDATNRLERSLRLKGVSPSWYSKVREIEKDFIRKLKYRAVPSLRVGMLGSIRTNGTIHVLEHIAMVFIKQDIEQMKVVNDILEGYDEIVTNGKFSLRSFNVSGFGKTIIALFHKKRPIIKHIIIISFFGLLSFSAYYLGPKFLNISSDISYSTAWIIFATFTTGYMTMTISALDLKR